MRVFFLPILFLGVMVYKPVEAAMFGFRDRIHKIQNIELKDSDRNALYLGYRTTMIIIGAGICLIDQGYVLGFENYEKNQYYPLTEELISSLQSEKILPTPLPTYNIDTIEYLFGYSLWIIMACIIAYTALKTLLTSRVNKANSEQNLTQS